MWGEIRIESDYDLDCTNSTNYWEETFVGDRAPDGSERLRCNLKGYGAYAGLQLRFEEWSDPIDPNNRPFTVAGEMLDPGKKK